MFKDIGSYRPVAKKFLTYVIPSVVSMIISSAYIILDGIFVGRGIGDVALAAVNIAFPLMFFVMALSMLVGIGGANVYSFLKGQGEDDKANNVFCQCMALLGLVGILVAIPAVVFDDQLARFLGANDELMPYVTIFLRWMAPFLFLQTIVMGLNVFVRNDGAPRLVMVATLIGSGINIILEYIFIMLMHLGIEYTVLANAIAVFIQIVFFLIHFARGRGTLRFHKPMFKLSEIKRIIANGFSTFLMEFSQSAVAYSFNLAFMNTVGTIGVTAYSIVTYIGAVSYAVMVGVVQGAQPIMSFHHGNGDDDTVCRGYLLGVATNLAASALYITLCFVFGQYFVTMFTKGNQELTALASHMFRVIPFSCLPIGISLMNINFFQTTERNRYSTLISFLRCLGFVQVFLLIFVPLLGIGGIYLALLAGEACTALLSIVFVRKTFRTLPRLGTV